jgi:protein O-GlcNAc transferase
MGKPPGRQRPPEASATLQRAVSFHQQGKLEEADRLYQAALRTRPHHFDALHLLGVLRAQQGRAAEAVKLISRAVEQQPQSADAQLNLGNALAALNLHSEALAAYDKALSLGGRTANALLNRAILLSKLERNAEALASLDDALSIDPRHAEALFNRGIVLANLNRLSEAIEAYDQVLAIQPTHLAALYNRGNALMRLSRHADAVASYQRAIALKPDHAGALANLGKTLTAMNRHDDALAVYETVMARRPDDPVAHYNRAVALTMLKRHEEAIASYERALSLDPAHLIALNNYGVVLAKIGRHEEALASYDKALAIDPDYVDALNNRGAALQAQERYADALACYERALALQPANVDALINRGAALYDLGRAEEALDDYDRALALEPRQADALYNRGKALHRLNRAEDAIDSYDRAVAIRPAHAEALFNRGNVLHGIGRRNDAIASYDRALAITPEYAKALINKANVLQELNRHEEAIASYEQALSSQPEDRLSYDSAVYSRAHICDWTRREDAERRLIADVRSGKLVSIPFAFLAVSDDPADQYLCAAQFTRERYPAAVPPLWDGEQYTHDRVRVAYVSADLHDHATAHLMAGLFEEHDRTKFEITAVSFGPDRKSKMRARLKAAFDRFLDVRHSSAAEIARTMRDLEIDVAVDLKGFTTEGRPQIFAYRPAPVQVSYLGYPGTLGADYMDYILADRVVIPPEQQIHYSEKVVYLPDSYQVNDSERRISEHTPRRADVGLPEDAFVFCSFNSNYKIGPSMFDVWMHLLKQVDSSVLWLLEGNATVANNLRREAHARGVDPARLVFARRANLADHLARHRLADLFLDTLPYNAHTTASDALWAGLPVLTLPGNSFAARVAASLLSALRLPELITSSIADYEALALRLARDPVLLEGIRQKLAAHRLTTPLFDTDLFRGHIEAAYLRMWEIQQQGEKPQAFEVERVSV